ncbi:RNA 2',3'-cyclic phosphodiesterase [Serinibacter arcticus]|uniref:RNA 2',3'-cyclic phosphodiesterase n=1 Tax=Serinibacter arcticus TaxID=1655435 RepID=A0A2U1ZVN9_9MICO|nr:RNA 2',3'-cyclic phosphodiesterase [Serinibacter arcticus]PWD51056.1 RNA 2',3'-cyclic phosphodiesterase [Serinibacter arcticus]
MRMFVALRVPVEAREDLETFLESRLDAFDVGWTPPEHWHLTLAFLGSVPERTLDDLTERLATAASRRSTVTLRLAGAGAIPDPFAARVLHLAPDLEPDARLELDRLSAAARTAATTSGIEVDGARFHPHVTLARSRHAMNAARWLQVMDTYRGPTWVADEIELVRSNLGEGRRHPRRHEVVNRFPLRWGQGG